MDLGETSIESFLPYRWKVVPFLYLVFPHHTAGLCLVHDNFRWILRGGEGNGVDFFISFLLGSFYGLSKFKPTIRKWWLEAIGFFYCKSC